jgi:IMP dehydrogenase
VDVVVVESSNGHSAHVLKTVERIKNAYPALAIIAGNVGTSEAVRDLALAGVDCVKVGVGAGRISTTRFVAGVGLPQLTAVLQCAEEAELRGLTLMSDGSINQTGDIAKAIGAGANTVMTGSLFAGTDESPGEVITNHGKRYKSYRGMGSYSAMRRMGGERYFQYGGKKAVAEGVSGLAAYSGALGDMVENAMGGLRAGMAYCGAKDIDTLRKHARFVRITGTGIEMEHPNKDD